MVSKEKRILIVAVLLTVMNFAILITVFWEKFFNIPLPQCYWMENYSGKFEWVPANVVYQGILTKSDCFDLDSCDGGNGSSNGGCYKWSTSAEAERIPW